MTLILNAEDKSGKICPRCHKIMSVVSVKTDGKTFLTSVTWKCDETECGYMENLQTLPECTTDESQWVWFTRGEK